MPDRLVDLYERISAKVAQVDGPMKAALAGNGLEREWENLTALVAQQKEMLDLIAYRRNAVKDASLGAGVEFFSFLRNLTTDGFYSSEIGIADLDYIGNTFLEEFPGCPPVPES